MLSEVSSEGCCEPAERVAAKPPVLSDGKLPRGAGHTYRVFASVCIRLCAARLACLHGEESP